MDKRRSLRIRLVDVSTKISQSYPFPCLGESPDLSELSQPAHRLWSAVTRPADSSLARASLTNFSAAVRYFALLSWDPSESYNSILFACVLIQMKFQWYIAVGVYWDEYLLETAHAAWHPVASPSHCRKIMRVCRVRAPEECVYQV